MQVKKEKVPVLVVALGLKVLSALLGLDVPLLRALAMDDLLGALGAAL